MLEFKAVRLAAHPRVSGENPFSYLLSGSVPGSSPRERGKRGKRAPYIEGVRLIPA